MTAPENACTSAPDYEGLVRSIAKSGPGAIGLLSRQSSPTAQILRSHFGKRLAALFSPEHGWYGFAAAGEKTDHETHPHWNVPVYSLYGASRRPKPEMFEGLSRVVVDLEDIGVRCFTYLATMKNMLEALSGTGIPATVLDRPIPLGGVVDGPVREEAFSSFVAPLDVPLCHGMTPCECAEYIVRRGGLDVRLDLVTMRDWSHGRRGPWANFLPPSPSIRSWDCAVAYPATVFTEAYPALDCDREGPLAFRVLGADWLDAREIASAAAPALRACGTGLRLVRYRPCGGRYAGKTLEGVLLSCERPGAYYPVAAGLILLDAISKRHPGALLEDARPAWLDKLAGTAAMRAALASGRPGGLIDSWLDAHESYRLRRVDLYGQS